MKLTFPLVLNLVLMLGRSENFSPTIVFRPRMRIACQKMRVYHNRHVRRPSVIMLAKKGVDFFRIFRKKSQPLVVQNRHTNM
jgi:hypothetical protein